MKKTAVLFFCLSLAALASTEDLSVKLEETVISGEGFYNTVRNTPKTIYTVTAEEIAENGAQSLPEALNMVPGVKIAEGYDGNGIIDIRGQGKQFNRNIAIIVDGVRMNPVDWGNVDLYSIPVETIEKIEIIPSNASVVYGDNSVGGVINITTKNNQKENKLIFGGMAESYKGAKGTIDFNSIIGNTTIFGNYLSKKSDGYRENSRSKYENIQFGLKSQLNENNSVLFKYSYNNSYKRLPGALSQTQYDQDREQAAKLTEWMFSESNRFLGAYTYTNGNLEILEQLSYQETRAEGDSSYKVKDLKQLDNNLRLKYIYGNNKIITGIDYSYGKADIPKGTITRSDEKEAIGIFVSDTYSVTDKLDFQGGIRYQETEYTYSKNFKTSYIKDNKYSNTVFNVGANYKYSDTGSTYLTFGKDFRTALSREMVSSNGWYEDIKPQESYSIELGIRDYYKDTYITSSIFYSLTKDEIYFSSRKPSDPDFKDSGVNTNYDGKSEKFGYELFLEKIVTEKLRLNGTYSFLYSKFKTGEFKDKYIPGVSKNKIALGAHYKITDDLNLNIIGTYYGSAYAWADDHNTKPKVDPYITVDLNTSYQINDSFKIYGGIKNIGNEQYNERIEHNSTSSDRKYYPAMERRYFIGFEYRAI